MLKKVSSIESNSLSNLFGPVQLEIWDEELPQHSNVEKVATDGVVLRNGVSELHALVVRRPVDSLIIEEVGKILVQEIHQPLDLGGCGIWRELLFLGDAAQPHRPLERFKLVGRSKAIGLVISRWEGKGGGRKRMEVGGAPPCGRP